MDEASHYASSRTNLRFVYRKTRTLRKKKKKLEVITIRPR